MRPTILRPLFIPLLLGMLGMLQPAAAAVTPQISAGTPMNQAEMVKQAKNQSAAAHRIEALADGRAKLPSPLQAIEATAAPEGITVVSTAKEEPGSLAIRAASLGRTGNKMTPLLPGKVSVEGQLARIVRSALIEEITTSSDGVRQDFVVAASPQGKGDLILELEVTGALLGKSINAATLTLESGRELLYHRLLVTDSAGKTLPARFEISGPDRLRIEVADSGAAYPIRIDPTITDADWVSMALPDAEDPVVALQVVDSNLYVAGYFIGIGGIAANYIAKWDGSSWSALGSGMDSSVYALAWDGMNLYAGGSFSTAGGGSANYIAKWDGSSWSALGSGMNSSVSALAWDGASLYASGLFTTAGGDSANYIAKWNGSSWSALGNGMNSSVSALAFDGLSLYAGGLFTTAGGISANYIAKWDGSNWSTLGSGMNSFVYSLAWDGASIYAGGLFTTAGVGNANYIAKWDGSSWSALGSGMNSSVRTLAWDGTNLYAGGDFTTAGVTGADYIAKWDGSNWSALGSGMNSPVYALAWDGTNLYAGGWFTTAGGGSANYIAKWNDGDWSALGSGTNRDIYAFAWDGTNLYAGGLFTTAGGVSANYIAKWNGSSWATLGSGMNNSVDALAWDGTNLYAGGAFTTAGGVSASRIAKWDGISWSALGSGMDRDVYALAWDGASLYAGGLFNTAGGVSANYIAKWNGSSWMALGNGMNSYVMALAWNGASLYSGGWFTTAGGISANRIAKWDGSSWSALGSGVNDDIWALAWDGANLYAGGDFTTAGGTGSYYIAKWDGSSWSPLGSGMNNRVDALVWNGTSIYAGGWFNTAGGESANYIAKWDGSNWSSLGSGVNDNIWAIAWDGTNLYVGGEFSAAGGRAARVAYVKLSRTITATAGANGGIISTNPVKVDVDAIASFTLVPNATYQPSSAVTGDCPPGSWNGNQYTTGAISTDCTVGFSFEKITYPLSLLVSGSGSITATAAGYSDRTCSGSCGFSYEIASVVTLTPVSGTFTGWTGACSGTGVCQVTMDGTKSVGASFTDITSPDTAISTHPPATTTSTSFSFTFTSTEAGSTFQCSINGSGWDVCTTPYSNSYVFPLCTTCRTDRQMSFSVMAKDPADNLDATPASYDWSITRSISSIIDSFITEGIVELQATEITEPLSFSRNIALTLKGGYSSDYQTVTGTTGIRGAVTIQSGSVIFDNISII